jgi:hypothetical protein
MNTETSTYPIRLMRGTTGTVHAGREVQKEILDFNAPYAQRWTGKFETQVEKACGYDPNTLRRVAGVGRVDADVTCKKCLKVLAS